MVDVSMVLPVLFSKTRFAESVKKCIVMIEN